MREEGERNSESQRKKERKSERQKARERRGERNNESQRLKERKTERQKAREREKKRDSSMSRFYLVVASSWVWRDWLAQGRLASKRTSHSTALYSAKEIII